MLKPLNDFVVLEVLEDNQTESGIIIPDTSSKKSNKAKVVAVSQGSFENNFTNGQATYKEVPMDVKKDDIVYFSEYAGVKVKDEGKEYILVRMKDIFAIVK